MPASSLATIQPLLATTQQYYQAAQRQRLPTPAAYNFFTLLGIHEQEVKHTALLADLLNPNGQHGLADAFLTPFLHAVGVPTHPPAEWEVTREESHRYGRWDIALHGHVGGRPALVLIENKINAAEGHQQLDRYLRAAQEHAGAYAPADTWLIFLTPDGRAPQSCLRPNGVQLRAWAYHDQIRNWLAACLPHTHPEPRLYAVLEQYLDLLTTYHNHHVQQSLSRQLADHLLQHNLLAEAEAVQDALVQARIELQCHFWSELEQELRRLKIPVVTDVNYTYSRERITDCYRKPRGSKGYGIAIELLAHPHEHDRRQLLLWIELGKHTLHFSVYLFQQGQLKQPSAFRRGQFGKAQLQQFADSLSLSVENDWALLYPPLTQFPLQFVPFELADMQRLAQPTERQKLVKAVAREAKQLYAKFPQA